MRPIYDVAVVGGGVIGMTVAWRCAQRGLTVAVVDPAPGSGASRTAAGMLAPVTELHYEGVELLALNVESATRYPDVAAELASLTGIDVGYRRCGTVQAAWDAADLAELRALHDFQAGLGVESRMLTGDELRDEEPALAAGLPGGLWAAAANVSRQRSSSRASMPFCRSCTMSTPPASTASRKSARSPWRCRASVHRYRRASSRTDTAREGTPVVPTCRYGYGRGCTGAQWTGLRGPLGAADRRT